MGFTNSHSHDKGLYTEVTDSYPAQIGYTGANIDVSNFLRFPWDTIQKYLYLDKYPDEDIYKYSCSYFRGKWWMHIAWIKHYLEWPHSVVLFSDKYPVCSVSYSFTRDGVLIHQMQWVKYMDTKRKRIANYHLDKFNWTKVLVEITGNIAKFSRKNYVYIQPALRNVALGAWDDSWEKIYDGTADNMWFSEPVKLIANLPIATEEKDGGIWRKIVLKQSMWYSKRIDELLS